MLVSEEGRGEADCEVQSGLIHPWTGDPPQRKPKAVEPQSRRWGLQHCQGGAWMPNGGWARAGKGAQQPPSAKGRPSQIPREPPQRLNGEKLQNAPPERGPPGWLGGVTRCPSQERWMPIPGWGKAGNPGSPPSAPLPARPLQAGGLTGRPAAAAAAGRQTGGKSRESTAGRCGLKGKPQLLFLGFFSSSSLGVAVLAEVSRKP